VPEVKLRHQQVQIAVCLSMTCGGASLKAVPAENTAVNKMTSTTLFKIRGVLGVELCPTMTVFSRGRCSDGKEWIPCSGETTQASPVAR
jgi:hypothetical protein